MTEALTLVHRSTFPVSARELYAWHARPGALERLIPPWDQTTVIARSGGIAPGDWVRLRLGRLPLTFTARHLENEDGRMFRDHQEKGPFSLWDHTHLFTDSDCGAILEDRVRYRLPLQDLLPGWCRRRAEEALMQIFAWRHRTLGADLALHRRCPAPMRILVTGASGVIGSALIPLLTTGGHQVWSLVRKVPAAGARQVFWDPTRDKLDGSTLPELDAVIHLAGEAIGLTRWTAAKKERVIESRIGGTRLLSRVLAALPKKPQVLVSASAVGYYGDCGSAWIDERHPPGNDFISRVCVDWEQAAEPAAAAGIRTALLRIGVVLTPRGGGLHRMTAGPRPSYISRFGSGRQYVSWIHIDDAISAILHILQTPGLEGPVNIAAPEPTSNSSLMATLARIQGRPCFPPVPAWFLRAVFGQMASEVVLAGCRVSVDKLANSGYQFRHCSLEPALRDLLGKTPMQSTIKEP